MSARMRNSRSFPQARNITAISGSPEWAKLSPLYRRVLTLSFAEENPMDMRAALRLAQSMNGGFQEADVEPTIAVMLVNPDVQAVIDLFMKPVPTGVVVRRS